MFPIRNGVKKTKDALSPLLFNFAVQYPIGRVNQDGLKLNGAHQFLVNADYSNMLGRSVHTIKKNAETLQVVSMENALDVNDDKTRCTVKTPRSEYRSNSEYRD
jgi:hypothetical protein